MGAGWDIFFWVAGGVWFIMQVDIMLGLRVLRRLPQRTQRARVTAVIAVRDEAARIEKTVRQAMGQQEVELQLIVVDDRSKDGTGDILLKLQGEHSAAGAGGGGAGNTLEMVRVDELPADWLGKCHAMHMAAQRATGEWIVFLDGDVWLAPTVVARAVAAANDEGVDHITLAPKVHAQGKLSLMFRSAMLVFQLFFNGHVGRANRDKRGSGAGIGAFNMVRAELYRQFGGHEKLRLEIMDDVQLGLLVRRAGKRSRVMLAGDDVACDWAGTVRSIIKVLEKNAFAFVHYNTVAGLLLPFVPLICLSAAATGLAAFIQFHSIAGAFAFAALVSYISLALWQARKIGWGVLPALTIPAGLFVLPLVMWNSTMTTLRQGGVRWRDTFYPLKQLRAGRLR